MTASLRLTTPKTRRGHHRWLRPLRGSACADISASRAGRMSVGEKKMAMDIRGHKSPDRAPAWTPGGSESRPACPEAAHGHGMAAGAQKWGAHVRRDGRCLRPTHVPSPCRFEGFASHHVSAPYEGRPFADVEDARPATASGPYTEAVQSRTGSVPAFFTGDAAISLLKFHQQSMHFVCS